jgi:hypothetical protein
VPAGRWIARCVGDAAVDVRIHGAGGADLPRDGDAVIVDGPIDIELVTGPGAVLPGRVEHVELRR